MKEAGNGSTQRLFRRSSKSPKSAPLSSSQGSRVVRAGPEKASISRLCSCIFSNGCHSWASVSNHPETLRGLRGAGIIPPLVQTALFPPSAPGFGRGYFFARLFLAPSPHCEKRLRATRKWITRSIIHTLGPQRPRLPIRKPAQSSRCGVTYPGSNHYEPGCGVECASASGTYYFMLLR